MRPAISIADVIRAFRALGPEDERQRRAITEVLGFTIAPGIAREKDSDRQVDAPDPGTAEVNPNQWKPVERPRTPDPEPLAANTAHQGRPTQFTIASPTKKDSDPFPWRVRTEEFEPQGRSPRKTVTLSPLLTPKGTRAILSTALGVQGPHGPIDLVQIVGDAARARPLLKLPRMRGYAIAPRVDVLIDIGESMLPFAEDQHSVMAPLKSVARADQVRQLSFTGTPLRGVGKENDAAWTQYSYPPCGSLVVLLTDFGIGQKAFGNTSVNLAAWRQFSVELRRRSVACTAFVPYPPKRWPAEVRRFFNIVQWDRATTAGSVKFSKSSGSG